MVTSGPPIPETTASPRSVPCAGQQALATAEQERDAAAKKLADTERRVVQMAKKRQAEHSAKVHPGATPPRTPKK